MRPSRLTPHAIEGLRVAFDAHPGDDPVELVCYDKRVVLPVRVDGSSRPLHAAVRECSDPAAWCMLVPADLTPAV